MIQELLVRAKAAELTPTERLVLDFLLKDFARAALLSTNEMGVELGVGASSVVRLSKKLGFESFTALRKAMQQELAQSREAPPPPIPYQHLARNADASDEQLLQAFASNVAQHMARDAAADNLDAIARVADAIVAARRVFVVGHRACAGFAASLVTMLTCCRDGVYQLGGQQPLIDRLVGLGQDDLLLAISFRRYSGDTELAVRIAREQGSTIVAMTDSYAAPIALQADHIVMNGVENFSFFNSYTSFVMNMEKLVLLTAQRRPEETAARLEQMEWYLDQTRQY